MRTLFIVDDEPAIRRLLELVFKGQGWAVATYENAEAALDDLSRSLPDAVLMDVHLPGMNGDVAVQRLRLIPGCRDLFVVLMSAEAEVNGQQANGFCSKPFDADELLALFESGVFGGQP